jgi:hypothetical protein
MILPKKTDIDKQKNDERKRLIDDGVILATKVDKLRETSANEEQRLKDWRESSLKLVQIDIAKFNEEKETVKNEIEEARRERDELLKPLTKEWEEIKKAKSELGQEITENYIIGEQLKEEERKLETEKEKLSNLLSKATQNVTATQKTKEESITLKNLTQNEYDMASMERKQQDYSHESISNELCQQKKEYEVALSLVKIRENEVKEKESELLTREKHLASQQVALRIAYEQIKKNESILPTNNK